MSKDDDLQGLRSDATVSRHIQNILCVSVWPVGSDPPPIPQPEDHPENKLLITSYAAICCAADKSRYRTVHNTAPGTQWCNGFASRTYSMIRYWPNLAACLATGLRPRVDIDLSRDTDQMGNESPSDLAALWGHCQRSFSLARMCYGEYSLLGPDVRMILHRDRKISCSIYRGQQKLYFRGFCTKACNSSNFSGRFIWY